MDVADLAGRTLEGEQRRLAHQRLEVERLARGGEELDLERIRLAEALAPLEAEDDELVLGDVAELEPELDAFAARHLQASEIFEALSTISPLALTWILAPLITTSPFFFTWSVASPTLSVNCSSASRTISFAFSL